MDCIAQSDALHARVQRLVDAPPSRTDFEAMALEIFEFQSRYQPGMRRMLQHRGPVRRLEDIPALTSEVFRWARVAVHSSSLDAACFETSGTTGSASGRHPVRRLDTYRTLSLAFARRAFGSVVDRRPRALALAPTPANPNTSSLSAMMRFFMAAFDGGAEAWLVADDGIELGRLKAEVVLAGQQGRPVLLLATSFALVALIDALGAERLACPEGTLVMQTGGFKGRTREVPAEELREAIARALDIPVAAVIGEYGMTELTSQLYEGTAPGSELSAPRGVYLEPPWLEVTPVHPATLRAVPNGEVGLARIVDLGNVDSAVVVLTEDQVRRTAHGIQVLGRRSGAAPRGCSLPFEILTRGYPDSPP